MEWDSYTVELRDGFRITTYRLRGEDVGVEYTPEDEPAADEPRLYEVKIVDGHAHITTPPPQGLNPYGPKVDSEWPEIIE